MFNNLQDNNDFPRARLFHISADVPIINETFWINSNEELKAGNQLNFSTAPSIRYIMRLEKVLHLMYVEKQLNNLHLTYMFGSK